MDPDIKEMASELRMPGEQGRSIPSAEKVKKQNAAIAREGAPAVPVASGRTEISTVLTGSVGGSQLLYQAESWVRVRLMLETAGPVAIGTREDVSPPLSGKGILLPPNNVEVEFSLAKGNRLFISSTALNRVRFIIEPIPWMEQVSNMVGSILTLLRKGR